MIRQTKYMMLLLALASLHLKSEAQKQTDSEPFDILLHTLSQPYLVKDSTLSFNVHYRYTDEANPDITLDSINGYFEINNNRYHSLIDSTESIINDSLSLTLFREDKVMYLSKVPVQKNPIQNPFLSISNEIKNVTGLRILTGSSASADTCFMIFPAGMPYKSVQIVSDKVTGYISRIVYLVKTEQLTDPTGEGGHDLSGYSTYAIITAGFTNYRKTSVNEGDFDNRQYFVREGREVKSAARFKDYKIYIGSSGL